MLVRLLHYADVLYPSHTGSGEFHVYKQARRREYERLRLMEEEDAKVRFRLPNCNRYGNGESY